MPDPYAFASEVLGGAGTATPTVAGEVSRPTTADPYQFARSALDMDLPPEEDLQRSHRAGLSVGRTPEEHAAYLKEKGYKPNVVKPLVDQYRLDFAKQNLGRFEGGKETIAGSVARQFVEHGIPFRSLFVNELKDQTEAAQRFKEGKATDEDIQTLAKGQRKAEDEERLRQSGVLGEVIGGLRAAPAIVGEFMTGGGLLKAGKIMQTARTGLGAQLGQHAGRMALLTPVMPSMYMDLARQKNLENGRPADSWEGLPAAGLHAYSHMLVLGGIFRGAPGVQGIKANLLGAAGMGAKGAVEMAVADSATNFIDTFLPKAHKISTGYGTFEKLVTGDVSGAARKFGVDAMTLAAFSGLHRLADGISPAEAAATSKAALDVIGKDIAVYHKEGYSADYAYEKGSEQYQRIKDQLKLDPDAAVKLSNYFRLRQSGMSHTEAYRQAFLGGEGSPYGIEKSPGQLQEGPKALEGSMPELAQPTEPTPPASPTPGGPPIPPSVAPVTVPAPAGETPPGPEIARPEASGASEKPTEAAGGGKIGFGEGVELKKGDRMDPSEAYALDKYKNLARLPVVDQAGKEVGKISLSVDEASDGKVLRVPWTEATGLAGGEGRGKPPFGAKELLRLAPEIAKAFPDAETLIYTPSAGRINEGKPQAIDLVKMRERGERAAAEPAKEPRPEPASPPVTEPPKTTGASGKRESFGSARRKRIEKTIEETERIRRTRGPLRAFLEEEAGYLDLEAIRKFLWRAGEWFKTFKSSGREMPEGVRFDGDNPLPRMDWNNLKRTASVPQGMGRIPLIGWLFDPARWDSTPEGQVFVGHAAMKETGKDVAALWAMQEKAADKLFGTAEDGTYTRGDGTRGRMADDIEAEMRSPGQKFLSGEQRAWVKEVWTPLLRDAQKMMRENGVANWVDEAGNALSVQAKAYFPRQAIGKKGVEEQAGGGGGGRPGTKAHFQKARRFDTEGEGSESIIYDPSAKSRVAKFISGIYRVIADHKLAHDAALQGKTAKERYDTLFAENAARLKQLDERGRADLLAELHERADNPVWLKESFVHSGPAFAGKIFPKEIADKIESQFRQESADWIRKVEQVSQASKGVLLGLDLSWMGIQLMPTLFRNPAVWVKAVSKGIQSIWHPEALSDYINRPDNMAEARRAVQVGLSFGRLQDFMAGLRPGEFATRIPGLGRVYEAAGRGFGAAMDVAKLELWKSWSKTAQPHELRNVAEVIDAMLLTGRMEGIGLSPQRMMAERLMMLAPAYYRGGLQLISTAFQRGTAGKIARQALGATIGGILIASVAAMKAVGLSDDEVEERLNPARGKFLKVPVELGDGKKMEVGTSNILTSYVRLLGGAADHFWSDRPIDTGADGNPILRWLRGKAAFAPRLAIDVFTGKDYFGNRIQPQEAVIRSFEPLMVQQILHGEGGTFEGSIWNPEAPGRANVADALVSMLGLSSYPGSQSDAKFAVLNDEAKRKYGKDYESLSIQQQAQVVKSAANRPDMPAKKPATATEMERASALQVERQRRITGLVSESSREKLNSLGKQLPAYLGTLSVNGVDVPLGRDRMRRYEELLAEEYDRTIANWNVEAIKARSAEAREDYLRGLLIRAKERARNRLTHESGAK